MNRGIVVVAVVVCSLLGLLAPSTASACERCKLIKICSGATDSCNYYWVCEPPPFGGLSFAECYDDPWGNCTEQGQICRFA